MKHIYGLLKSWIPAKFASIALPACLFIAAMSLHGHADESKSQQVANEDPAQKALPFSKVKWTLLNAARGDQSPQVGTLWGNRNGTGETGYRVKFKDGFSSPPHIQNVTYRGVVISGLVHNDDPKAAKMWMPGGSYWTQLAGEAHITAAMGKAGRNLLTIKTQN